MILIHVSFWFRTCALFLPESRWRRLESSKSSISVITIHRIRNSSNVCEGFLYGFKRNPCKLHAESNIYLLKLLNNIFFKNPNYWLALHILWNGEPKWDLIGVLNQSFTLLHPSSLRLLSNCNVCEQIYSTYPLLFQVIIPDSCKINHIMLYFQFS